MIVTTTNSIEGHRITALKGVVVGNSMLMVSASGTAVLIE